MARSFELHVRPILLVLVSLALLTSARPQSQPAGLFARLFGATEETKFGDSGTGGSTCVGCVLVVGVVEQLAELYNTTVEHAMEKLCNYLPSDVRPGCKTLVDAFGPAVIDLLEKKETPDAVCHAITLCKNPAGTAMCHLFPLPSSLQHAPAVHVQKHLQNLRLRARDVAKRHSLHVLLESLETGSPPDFCNWPVIKDICDIINKWTGDHLPVDDLDGDKFSDLATARGSSWRGKDCNDSNADMYPGRRPLNGDAVLDSNCNGIAGVDSTTGKTYEELFCANTTVYGTMVLGDSIGAHFHIPPEWMNVSEISEAAFQPLLFSLTNELDWPQLSTGTGHFNASKWPNDIQGPMDSIYQRLFELNRCNHRDYQNIAVNGARSTAMAQHIVQSMARNQANDEPLMIVLELVGNDVCSGHPGTSHMTPPQEFYDAELATLRYLDAHIPAGSHVILVGLVDGRFLYDNMHARVHPVGSLRGDVTYKNVYDFLECNGVTPCWGWLNSNETWRNATTEHAFLLNAQLQKLAETENFTNFDVVYTIYNIQAAAEIVKKDGGQPWQLIEPVDGFHANQLGNAIATEVFWKVLAETKPNWLPPSNPHNEAIVAKFGNQGGYQ